MVYETTGASEGLLRYASEPMLAKVLSIGLCLVHVRCCGLSVVLIQIYLPPH